VELLETTPSYAYTRYPNGREDTVSLKDLAPFGPSGSDPIGEDGQEINIPNNVPEDLIINDEDNSAGPTYATEEPSLLPAEELPQSRRSTRIKTTIDRWGYSAFEGGD